MLAADRTSAFRCGLDVCVCALRSRVKADWGTRVARLGRHFQVDVCTANWRGPSLICVQVRSALLLISGEQFVERIRIDGRRLCPTTMLNYSRGSAAITSFGLGLLFLACLVRMLAALQENCTGVIVEERALREGCLRLLEF